MVNPEPKRITPHALKLLDALKRNSGVWQGRTAIAEAIGKNRLTPYDIALLDMLAERGEIKSRKSEGGGRDGYTWEYRITQGQ